MIPHFKKTSREKKKAEKEVASVIDDFLNSAKESLCSIINNPVTNAKLENVLLDNVVSSQVELTTKPNELYILVMHDTDGDLSYYFIPNHWLDWFWSYDKADPPKDLIEASNNYHSSSFELSEWSNDNSLTSFAIDENVIGNNISEVSTWLEYRKTTWAGEEPLVIKELHDL